MRVCIDPGHGGDNVGTCHGDLVEKDLTLKLTDHLFDAFAGYTKLPIQLSYIRHSDDSLSQKERGQISKDFKADLVISIHVNASPNPHASGMQTYHLPGQDDMAVIGETILRSYLPFETQRTKSIVAYDDPINYIDNWKKNAIAILTAHEAPTLLVECGFATNEKDRAFLLTDSGQMWIANSIRAGILHYYHLWRSKQ